MLYLIFDRLMTVGKIIEWPYMGLERNAGWPHDFGIICGMTLHHGKILWDIPMTLKIVKLYAWPISEYAQTLMTILQMQYEIFIHIAKSQFFLHLNTFAIWIKSGCFEKIVRWSYARWNMIFNKIVGWPCEMQKYCEMTL